VVPNRSSWINILDRSPLDRTRATVDCNPDCNPLPIIAGGPCAGLVDLTL